MDLDYSTAALGNHHRLSNGNVGEFSRICTDAEVPHRSALQSLMERLNHNGVNVPSISYLRKHFDPDWPSVAEWVDEATPGL